MTGWMPTKMTSATKLIHVTCSFGRPAVLIMNFCM